MSKRNSSGVVAILLIVGGVAGAFSKWYLVWLAQYIGGADLLGEYGTVLAVATPLYVLGQLGLRTILLTISRIYPWRTYVVLRWGGLVSVSLLLLLYFALSSRISMTLGLAILSLKVADSILDLDLARIQWSGNLFRVALLSLLGAPISMIFSTVAAYLTHSLVWSIWGATLGSLIVALVAGILAKRVPYEGPSEASGFKEILRASVPVTTAQLLASLLLYLPVLVLSFASDLRSVGIFTGTAYILTAADLVGSSISKILLSKFRTIKELSGKKLLRAASRKISYLLTGLGMIAGIILVFVGNSIFELIYGGEFGISTTVLVLYSLGAIFIVLSFVQSVALNVLNNYYGVALAYGLACIVALVVGAILVLMNLDGIVIGAAMAACGAFVRFFVLAVSVEKSALSKNHEN